jgi:cation transport ATPase
MPNPIKNFFSNLIKGSTGELVTNLGNTIDKFIQTPEEKQAAAIEMAKIVNEHEARMTEAAVKALEAEENNISARWNADMSSDSWLSKNSRPLVLMSMVGFLFLMIIFDSLSINFEIKESYINLMETLLITVVVAYFGSRGVEKYHAIKRK